MDPLDPAWAAIIGTGVGALATALGSAIGPIVKDAIQRRATRADNTTDARRRIAVDLVESLDALANAPIGDRREIKARIDRLSTEGSLFDKSAAFSDMVFTAQMYSLTENTLVRMMVGSYFEGLIKKWARNGSIPPAQEYAEIVRQTGEVAARIAERNATAEQ